MTFCAAPSNGPMEATQGLAMRRGACPSLSTPMMTGDGLLARLRPEKPEFALRDLMAIADAAASCGNGILEITARGNLQIRGLTTRTVPLLSEKIAEAGIAIAQGLAIETPPLSGLDQTEVADAVSVAERLRVAVAAHQPPLVLAPKLSVIIDGGGQLNLGAVTADIRLRAMRTNGQVFWLLALAGTETTATRIAALEEAAVVPAVMDILKNLAAIGRDARARDIVGAVSTRWAAMTDLDLIAPLVAAPNAAGIHDLGGQRPVLGIGLPFGQIDVQRLVALLEALEILGATEIRLAPGQALMVLGIAPDRIGAAQALALGHGLRAFPRDPRNHIAACAGAGACGSARIDTRSVAQLVADTAPALLDGSLTVHVSGCAKGCAKPSASALTITAAPTGYGLVVNGPASAAPTAYIEENNMRTALEHLDKLVSERKQGGESARSCLTRLGADGIRAAVQQG
ncbi:precorrin-3B synthase [Rhizobium sp. LjRoot98]|uniref:precorrin-3B synthase n=1 Tax=unclassified Rhizobium TaxID=2613769 RepID=UPI00071326D6|nr:MULTISPECIES: precorrin-3B synthase [unclassified Rhizobium]KQV39002.1 precorrin-3B synthase [Rhizobium sp. Root1204]KQY16032.1 precorrin-3B synthase [Rhizobium sp. Root1334]KRC10207.1 precorrin-3B synthase [Rhizobium sp. Root73]